MTGGHEKKSTSGDHSNHCIIEIGQNTEKSTGDLRRLEETCCLSKSSEKPSANAGVKNLKREQKIMIIINPSNKRK